MPEQQGSTGGESHAFPNETSEAPASEQAASLLGKYASIDQVIYKNGVKHVYGVDEDGKKRHLSHDAVLEYYGHAGESPARNFDDISKRNKERFDEIRRSLGLPIVPEPAEGTRGVYSGASRDEAIFGPGGALADFRNGLRANSTRGQENVGTDEAGADHGGGFIDTVLRPPDSEKSKPGHTKTQRAVENLSEQGMKGHRFKRARDELRKLPLRGGVVFENGAKHAAKRVGKFYHDPEISKRKKILVTAVGAVALGAAAFGIYELTQLGGSASSGGKAVPPNGELPFHHPPVQLPQSQGPHAHQAAHSVELANKSNPWEMSEQQLQQHGNAHPTNAQILQYDKELGRANGYRTWADWVRRSFHLAAGKWLKQPK